MKMKNLFLMACIAMLTFSCNGGKSTTENNESAVATRSNETVYTIDSLLSDGENLVGKEVVIKGIVTHTCKHSGRRCFIVGEDGKTTLRVEAKGDIGGFNRELIGSELLITGIVRENRLTQEYLDQYAEQLKEKAEKGEGSAESCASEQNNLEAMKEWMKAHNKDYYSTYFIDGQSYEVAE